MRLILHIVIAYGLLHTSGVTWSAGPVNAADTDSGTSSIQWFGTWKEGVREATKTGRPIFLVSAAPHCHSVPGIW